MYNSHFKHNIHMCRLSKGSDILHASYRVLIFDSPGKLESRYDYEHFKFAASDWKWLLYANVKSRAIKKQMKAFVNINIVYEKDNTEENRKHTFFFHFYTKRWPINFGRWMKYFKNCARDKKKYYIGIKCDFDIFTTRERQGPPSIHTFHFITRAK